MPQREVRTAYEAVTQAEPEQYAAARAAFDQQYGPAAWGRQQRLGLRRQDRERGH